VRCALGSSLIPILCVGETLEQRENGQEFEIIRAQLRDCLRGVSTVEAGKLVIAYEPIWAIGTGETATPEIAQKTHAFIRSILTELFDSKAANAIKILYGGSMKPDNAEALLSKDDVDGGLIGGASLNHKSFAEIIKIAGKLSN
jgi:triosephosphate isomerase